MDDAAPSPDESFVDYIKTQEGFRSWPYPDGTKENPGFSIGHGRFRTYKTIEEAVEGFGAPWSRARGDEAVREDIAIHIKKAAVYVSDRFGDAAWNGLSALEQHALTDMAFTPGITEFPKLTRAVVERDRFRIAKEFRRHSKGDPLPRNKAWWAKFGRPITGIKYRDTKSVDRLVDFFDDAGVYAGDI